MNNKIHREQISEDEIIDAVQITRKRLTEKLQEKGYGTFSSRHEILGVISEEFYELNKVIHEKGNSVELIEELSDIAVGAIFGIACINSGKVDW